MLIADARQAVKESAPLDRLRSLTAELQQIYHALTASRPAGESPPGPGRGSGSGPAPGGDDDVIDADFTVS